VTIQLGIPLGLPPAWIGEENLRMALYKKVAAAHDADALVRVAREAEDRYGTSPPEFARLLAVARLRLVAQRLGVKALHRRGPELAASLEKDHRVDPEKILTALRKGTLTASGPDSFRVPKAFEAAGGEAASIPGLAEAFLASIARAGALA
jgi:transcription-repair coupling factor (superfamily II helicase)